MPQNAKNICQIRKHSRMCTYMCVCVYILCMLLERQHLIYTLTRFIKIKINPEMITINFLKILEDRIRLLHQVL